MKLLVYWGLDDEADLQIPKEVRWEDGTQASLDDYNKHQSDTQTTRNTDQGMVTIISPDIVAFARFDTNKAHRVLEAPGGGPFDLEETDPNASDEILIQETSCYPVAFKTAFDRSHLSSKSEVVALSLSNQPTTR